MRRIATAALALVAAFGSALAAAAVPAAAANAASGSTLLLGLNGVSCVSAKFCAAVGAQGDSAYPARGNVPLTMIWNGAHWRKTATPLAKGWPQGELYGVSCTSAAYCVAVGENYRNGHYSPLAQTWNGRAWTAIALPAVTGSVYFHAQAVSCGAARDCVDVGYYSTPRTVARPFLATLSGTKWTVRDVPLPKGSRAGGFAGVSCLSAARCVVAGGYYAGRSLPLFETWNGKALAPMNVASPAGSLPSVTGVSCASAKSCAAIGATEGFYGEPAAALWNGRAWSVVGVPVLEGLLTRLVAVSCASAARCVAAGVVSTNGSEETSHATAESFNGRSWAPMPVPVLANGGTSQFEAVSCASARYCVAVGEGGGPGHTLYSSAALTGLWNGTGWRLVRAS
jgi:hypothetical protein